MIFRRGGWLAKLQEMYLPDFLSHLQPCQPIFCQERSRSSKNGENRMTPDHIWAHSSALGPFCIPKTRYSWIPYTMRPSCMLHNRIQGGQKMTFLTPSWLIFSWFFLREMAGILYLTNHRIFSPHFLCSDIIYRIKSSAILMTWFGAAVGQIQHTGAWKVGFTPRRIRHKGPRLLQWN